MLEKSAEAAIKYLAENISWQGVLDFVIRWDKDRINFWPPEGPGFLAYGDSFNGMVLGLEEAITGFDINGKEFDVGMWVNPENTSIKTMVKMFILILIQTCLMMTLKAQVSCQYFCTSPFMV